MFEPFRRLEDSRRRESGGSGLGHTIARQNARAQGRDGPRRVGMWSRADGQAHDDIAGAPLEVLRHSLQPPSQGRDDRRRAGGRARCARVFCLCSCPCDSARCSTTPASITALPSTISPPAERSPSATANAAPMMGAKANTEPVRAAPKARRASRQRRRLRPPPVAPMANNTSAAPADRSGTPTASASAVVAVAPSSDLAITPCPGARSASARDSESCTPQAAVASSTASRPHRGAPPGAAIASRRGSPPLRAGKSVEAQGGACAISVQLGDEPGNQDDHHRHGTGHGFATGHRHQCRDRHEVPGADLAFANQVEPAGLDRRVEAERRGGPQHRDGHRLLPVRPSGQAAKRPGP
ncbi:MAG: hypothetical protein C0505_06895 [Leptothrix sp. (in: Bacteria)]|nr:hypothetical protein [Leptothrix sp. (in: b-proteobacteria)]